MANDDTRTSPATVIREFALAGALFGAYKLGRLLALGHEGLATEHAQLVHRIEGWLWLPSEAAIQAAVHSETLFRAANLYYTYVHFPLIAVFLLWGLLRRPLAEYRWARNLWILQTSAALVLHVGFPLAPPRMFPQWGFTDTMTRYGPSPYDGASGVLANQFAAMPSLHVGWAVLIAYVVVRTGPRWLGCVAVGHATLTVAIVIVTANHWWVDAAAGIALLVLAEGFLRAIGAGLPRSAPVESALELGA
ncbi:phosphatase PAP2 family protein [Aeromicrobium sp. 179-A 4D2 NHS]|uniref:phosphatase PAP2 family protein n=1 Tax=Aeromicrobium sp. 179-A 4D2 NHS TaxID=3142375 RepID=UPI0039A34299